MCVSVCVCVYRSNVRPENYKMKRTFEFPTFFPGQLSTDTEPLSRPRVSLSFYPRKKKKRRKRKKLEIHQDRWIGIGRKKGNTIDGVPCRETRARAAESRDSKGMPDRKLIIKRGAPGSSSSIEDQSPKCCPIFLHLVSTRKIY